jgi:GMP synthase (glutamine-hydrolysing)
MGRLFIIKVGDTFPELAKEHGDFDRWVAAGLGLDVDELAVAQIHKGDALPLVEECRGVVVTGSHAMVTENHPWSARLAAWIPMVVRRHIPYLGICYGHQLLAKAMGGKVSNHPQGREIGTVDIDLFPESRRDALFAGLPGTMPVHSAHSQTVLSLPHKGIILAGNAFEAHHAFRIGDSAWGVQFHPEFDARIMTSYIKEQSDDLRDEGLNVRSFLAHVKPTPDANGLLRRFATLTKMFAEPSVAAKKARMMSLLI